MGEETDIVLVEDSEDDAVFFKRALAATGMPVKLRRFRDGAEALAAIFGTNADETALRLKPRLVVLDLKMPKVSGMEVLQRLKASPQTRGIPVVLLSSSQEKRDVAVSYELGANSCVNKPLDFDEYTDMVRTLCRYWLRYNQLLKPENLWPSH